MFLSAFAFTSCIDDDEIVFNNSSYIIDFPNVTNAEQFTITPIIDITQPVVSIDVPIRLVSNQGTPVSEDINGTYSVDTAQSTAVEGVNFELTNNSTFTLPANQGQGSFSVDVTGTSIDPEAEPLVLVLKLLTAEANSVPVEASGKTKTNTIYVVFSPLCPINESLAGTHDVRTYNLCAGDGSGPANCSDINGYEAFTTTVWTEPNPLSGVIEFGDASYGMYASAYEIGDAIGGFTNTFSWACKTLIFTAEDQYSDPFTFTVEAVVGPVMTLRYENTWGDICFVDVTREGGADWPSLLQTQ